ncbi:MAG: nucleotidyl transferase AbiEii/AbiGii toxin family protein [Nitrosomonadales bacterium]|nr:nucleotidyl transferase AbiEii/AbiGii toxin family protein [Nitrosomonadales bacterium]
MLKLDCMPERTRRVFQELAQEPLMKGFVLIGGTALSIQIGHRLSEDLDFWLPAISMSKDRVDSILFNLGQHGLAHEFATPAWKISQARINGIDLLSQSRDHIIDGVKVTFFARDDVPYRHFAQMKRLKSKTLFSIADEEALFNMKSWLISQRVRSRDLYDLMMLMQRGKTIQDILEAGAQADPSFQREYAKEVLVGNVPLDADDEGFESIGVEVTLAELREFFLEAVNEFEVNLASAISKAILPEK